MKVLAILGTRPEAIKLAPVVSALRRRGSAMAWICDTGQHRDLVSPMLALFGLDADRRLEVMREDQSPADVASAVLAKAQGLLEELRPDWLIVQGDTTTATAGALAGAYAGVKVAHVEAGLRSGDRSRPFPEEINRRAVSALADLHCAPTARARANLLAEGVDPASIRLTGNPVVDALSEMVRRPPPAAVGEVLDRLGYGNSSGAPERLILVTAHRRESFGEPLERICLALRDVAAALAGRGRILFPVHPNPNVRSAVGRLLEGVPWIHLTPPLDYIALVHLMKRADLVLTDSGGIQEEAPSLGVPVLVLRDVTERPEGVEAGWAWLVGTDRDRILKEALRVLSAPRLSAGVNPYGDGRAAERIVSALFGEEAAPFAWDGGAGLQGSR